MPLSVEFLVHDPQGGEEIAKEEEEEGEAAHDHLKEEPGLGQRPESGPPSDLSRGSGLPATPCIWGPGPG